MQEDQKQKAISYWKEGAKVSLHLANDVLKKGYYDHALFCGHLALEKRFKSKVISITHKPAPHSHDLLYLAGLAKIDLDLKQQQFLAEVNTYNIEGRYPEEQLEFHKNINKTIAQKQLKNINQFFQWLSRQNGRS